MEKSKRESEIKRLCKNECANYCDGLCLPRDIGCTQFYNGTTIVCKYFMDAVLPLNPELKEILVTDLLRRKRESDLRNGVITAEEAKAQEKAAAKDKGNYRTCVVCGKTFIPTGRSQKYCPACKDKANKKKQAETMRAKRAKRAAS